MAEANKVELHHPITGGAVTARSESHARILERSGWRRGAMPTPLVSSSLEVEPEQYYEEEEEGS